MKYNCVGAIGIEFLISPCELIMMLLFGINNMWLVGECCRYMHD